MNTLLITIVPSILILLYFFLSDRFKEPKGSIALVFFLGILICLPAGIINDFMYENFNDGSDLSEKLYSSFLGPAWAEEKLEAKKFIPNSNLLKGTKNDSKYPPYFQELIEKIEKLDNTKNKKTIERTIESMKKKTN